MYVSLPHLLLLTPAHPLNLTVQKKQLSTSLPGCMTGTEPSQLDTVADQPRHHDYYKEMHKIQMHDMICMPII